MGTIPGKYAVEMTCLFEVESQCIWAIRAFDEVALGADQHLRNLGEQDVIGPFFGSPLALHYAVHSFLVHAKIVSDFFFDGKGRKSRVKRRCERLRALTGVSESDQSALGSLSLRNYLMHIDEKIDEIMFYNWDETEITFHPMHVSPPNIALGPNQYAIRLIDAKRLVARVLDEELALEPVRRDIARVQTLAHEGMCKLSTFAETPLYKLYRTT